MKEPLWLTREIVEAIHLSQIREHGGQYEIKDTNLFESTLARPINRRAYEQESDIYILAAAYGYGLAKNHCFIDGNKKVAFMAMYTLLSLNGYEICATEPEVVDIMLGVADGSLSEEQLIAWLRKNAGQGGN